MSNMDKTCDVLIFGSGAGGMSTAVTAKMNGLNPIIIEKAPVFGGTTAFSGGVLWIPGNDHTKELGVKDTREAARTYIKNECGNFYDETSAEVFLDKAPEMIKFFERETAVKFIPTLYPDYHPLVEGGIDVGRSILAKPFDIRQLGKDIKRMRPPLETITFIGMMFNSSNADLKHFFKATKSLTSFLYVLKRLAIHFKELALYRRGVQVTSGNALAASLAKSCMDLNIPILTETQAIDLIREGNRITGATVKGPQGNYKIMAKKAVILACGGFSHDIKRIRETYPHLKRGGEHFSPVPSDNTGDGVMFAEKLGANVEAVFQEAAAWMPTSKISLGDGRTGAFPHLLDRYKPGIIGLTPKGERFCNESESYHDVGAAMIKACENEKETFMWLVCDQKALGKYGLGFVKPAPMPIGKFLKSGYLLKGKTLKDLANKISVDPMVLEQTISKYNSNALNGKDPEFNRGRSSFNRYLADPEQKPNPCVAPLNKGPFYAIKVLVGDLGTFDGIETNIAGQVLRSDKSVIDGLYAVGNDRRSIMGGNYPGAGITLGPIMTFGYVTARHIAGVENLLAK
jgi:succinate dehydrogenase/fumarate reductase flavoprotein subunit